LSKLSHTLRTLKRYKPNGVSGKEEID